MEHLSDEEVHCGAHEADGFRLLKRVGLHEEVESVVVGAAHGHVKVATRQRVGVNARLVDIREDSVWNLELVQVVRVGKAVDKDLLERGSTTDTA